MKAFDYSLVKDPQYFCDNRMEAHSDHVYYRDGNEMQAAVQDPDMAVKIMDIVGFLLPDPEDLIHGTL